MHPRFRKLAFAFNCVCFLVACGFSSQPIQADDSTYFYGLGQRHAEGIKTADIGMIYGLPLAGPSLRGLTGFEDHDVPCDPMSQFMGLAMFYKATGGAHWTNSSGWPTTDILSSDSSRRPPIETGTCRAPGTGGLTFPDHCW